MSLDQLAVFSAVADAGGFTLAAKRLRLPKSSVSRAVAALESSLGVRLVNRTTRRVALTADGAALHERAAPLLAALTKATTLPARAEQPAGTLRVTASVDFGAAVLADVVARFVARYPLVRVDVHLSNAVIDLVAGGFDVALRIASKRLPGSSLVARAAGSLSTQLYAAPAYLARRGVPRAPRDLAGHEWVVHRSRASLRLEAPGASSRVVPRGRVTCDDMFFVRAAVSAGVGVGLLPAFLADPDVVEGRLVRVLPRWTVAGGTVWLVWPGGGEPPPKVLAFRDFVLHALAPRRR